MLSKEFIKVIVHRLHCGEQSRKNYIYIHIDTDNNAEYGHSRSHVRFFATPQCSLPGFSVQGIVPAKIELRSPEFPALQADSLPLWRRKWQPTPVFLPRKSQWIEEPGRL